MIEYQIELGGCQCAVVEWNPSGKTLVFGLHGWLDNLATFESLIEFLPEIRLIAFDFPGHGHSAHIPAGAAYHFIDGIYFIDDLANHFQQEKINLLGHSMGGALSCLYAAAQPEKVNKLMLIESLGPLTASAEESVDLLNKALSQRSALTAKRKPVYGTFAEALAARAAASNIQADLISGIVGRGLSKVDKGYTWRADSRLRVPSATRLASDQLERILANIAAPTAVIEGSTGFFQDNSLAEARRKQFARLTSLVVEGGHHVHLEQPAECSRHINEFFLN
ncbi:alpha/beta hydrolase [Aliikangiella marina]|uniref:Alpha/beta hydrolase n=1 Tax=Aliikangiella marina TaxID=1712262 RepID=A0A545TIE2_9GAMM|nr:alpha/beta hydrolase [Aliikangiella marina]TQV76994.1 alpha/beta hydrolase [Aliikangiella marina]